VTFDDIYEAVSDAKITIERADNVIDKIARLISGRLRSAQVSASALKKLKRELRNFNIHTGTWKDFS